MLLRVVATCWKFLDEVLKLNAGAFSGANFIIPKEFLFLFEVVKPLYYYISYYFFMYFEIQLRLTHSSGLTIENEDVPPSLFFCYC